MNKEDGDYVLRWAKKIRAVNHLGGECQECGSKDPRIIEFHHPDENKEINVNQIFGYSWETLLKEIDKCILLCRNCHFTEHFSERKSIRSKNNKRVLLEFTGKKECENCGWNKHTCALNFHHMIPSEKNFNLGDLNVRLYTIQDLEENIIEEINKCEVICCNCHQVEHISPKFEKFKTEIYEKVENFRNNKRLDRNEIRRLYSSGMKQSEICRKFDLSKSSVFSALKDIR